MYVHIKNMYFYTFMYTYMYIYKHISHNWESQPYKAAFSVKRNVTKFKDALLNYDCVKLAVVHIVYCQNSFVVISYCTCSELACY